MLKVLFDSQAWLGENPNDYIDEFLECVGRTRDDYKPIVTNLGLVFDGAARLNNDILEWFQENSLCDWEDFLAEAKKVQGKCLVKGYFMAWNGKKPCGKVFDSLAEAIQNSVMDGDSHPIFSINKEGHLYLDETHHDSPCAGNHYEFYILTARGEQFYGTRNGKMNAWDLLVELEDPTKKRVRPVGIDPFYLSEEDFIENEPTEKGGK